MALYCGLFKYNINLDGLKYRLILSSETDIVDRNRLLSSDGYILTDLNGAYLTVIEKELSPSVP